MTAAKIPWTEDRLNTVKTLWAQGVSALQIAKHLGDVTRNAVIGQVHRKGWQRSSASAPKITLKLDAAPRFRWTDERNARLEELFALRWTDAAIAEDIGTTGWSVTSRRKVIRLLREPSGGTPKPAKPLKLAVPPTPILTAAWVALSGVAPMARTAAQARHCQWPITVEGDELSHCCSAIVTDGPYCPTHKRRAMSPRQPLKPKADKREFSHARQIFGRAA